MLHIATIGKPHGIKGSVSIQSKTLPGSLIFSMDLFYQDGDTYIPFPIANHEQHHQKLVLQSELIADRTQAMQYTHKKLYCDKVAFFKTHPDQIYGNLCRGYQVINDEGSIIGELSDTDLIQGVLMGFIHQEDQQFNLPMMIKDIDHENQCIHLDYCPE